jgi:hypothetical protein
LNASPDVGTAGKVFLHQGANCRDAIAGNTLPERDSSDRNGF